MINMTMSDNYRFVETVHNGVDIYGVELLKGTYGGIIIAYGAVKLVPEGDHAVLSFDYDVIKDNFNFAERNAEEFEEYLGEILEEILRNQLMNNEVVYTGGVDGKNRKDDTFESDPQ